jgi:hypothetical protein
LFETTLQLRSTTGKLILKFGSVYDIPYIFFCKHILRVCAGTEILGFPNKIRFGLEHRRRIDNVSGDGVYITPLKDFLAMFL